MKKLVFFSIGIGFLLAGFQESSAQNATPSPVPTLGTPSTTPTAKPKKKKKKPKALGTVTPTQTVLATTTTTAIVTAIPSPTVTSTPTVSSKASAKAVETATPTTNPVPMADSLTEGDGAYASKDYAKALAAYSDYEKKNGKTPEVEKKLLLSKFYAGEALEKEARLGFKEEDNLIKSDRETHNIQVYGKSQPSREDHLVTLSLAFLTPQLAGGDIGLNFLAHWNVGVGIGPAFWGFDPRIKYYFDGDNASFFLGAGYATYNLNNLSVGDGSLTATGSFLHFTFGPSFQDKDGFFMEIPFDVGLANIKYSATGGGSGTSGSYNGPAGTIGFRWGYSL